MCFIDHVQHRIAYKEYILEASLSERRFFMQVHPRLTRFCDCTVFLSLIKNLGNKLILLQSVTWSPVTSLENMEKLQKMNQRLLCFLKLSPCPCATGTALSQVSPAACFLHREKPQILLIPIIFQILVDTELIHWPICTNFSLPGLFFTVSFINPVEKKTQNSGCKKLTEGKYLNA